MTKYKNYIGQSGPPSITAHRPTESPSMRTAPMVLVPGASARGLRQNAFPLQTTISICPTYISPLVAEHIREVYERLSEPGLLRRCIEGKPQNANEGIRSHLVQMSHACLCRYAEDGDFSSVRCWRIQPRSEGIAKSLFHP